LAQVYGIYNSVQGFFVGATLGPLIAPIIQTILPGPLGVYVTGFVSGLDVGRVAVILDSLLGAADQLDVALDILTTPLAQSGATDLAQPLLTGILAAVLGTDTVNPGVAIGTTVGSVGFPDQGLVGAGIEIALPVDAAFPFIERQILGQMDPAKPFFGYVSV